MTTSIFLALVIGVWALIIAFAMQAFRPAVSFFHDNRMGLLQRATAIVLWATMIAATLGMAGEIYGYFTEQSLWIGRLLSWALRNCFSFFFIGLWLHLGRGPLLKVLSTLLGGAALGLWIYQTAVVIAAAFA
jgi:hypothetical protein